MVCFVLVKNVFYYIYHLYPYLCTRLLKYAAVFVKDTVWISLHVSENIVFKVLRIAKNSIVLSLSRYNVSKIFGITWESPIVLYKKNYQYNAQRMHLMLSVQAVLIKHDKADAWSSESKFILSIIWVFQSVVNYTIFDNRIWPQYLLSALFVLDIMDKVVENTLVFLH